MRQAALALFAAAGLIACLPTFPEAECYADVDCPSELVCNNNNRCVPPVNRRDGGVGDAGFRDAGRRDSGAATDSGVLRDGGPLRDAGLADAGFDVRVSPLSIDFGVRALGCSETLQRVTVENRLMSAVQIDNIQLTAGTSSEYDFTAPATPFTLPGQQARTIDVGYLPTNAGMDQGALQITYADGNNRLEVSLSGEGQMNPEVSEMFTATVGPIDVLFVVDSGPNMTQLQQRLSNRVLFTLLQLDVEGWDYRIAVTTMDTTATGAAGMFVGTPTIIVPTTPNRLVVLENRLVVGATGPAERRGFDAVELALSSPLIDGVNAGFLRTDAPLLVIYFSADDDASMATVATHLAFLNGLKVGTTQPVVANGITPTIFACALEGGVNGFEGIKFIDLVDQTMGTLDNLCGNDWDDAITTLPPPTVRLDYTLQDDAIANTIVVSVDGTDLPSNGGANWTYDAPTRTVTITNAAAPLPGATVLIRYQPSC